MDVFAIKRLVDRHPFVPLRFVTSDGTEFEVPHRQGIFVTLNTLLIGVNFGSDGIPEEARMINVTDVIDVSSVI